MPLLDRDSAIEYIQAELDNPWGNPKRSLSYHLDTGNLKPIGERIQRKEPKFNTSELDRFIEWLNNLPGHNHKPADSIPEDIRAMIGQVPDSVVSEISERRSDSPYVSRRWVLHYRKDQGIPAYKPDPLDSIPEDIRAMIGQVPDSQIAEMCHERDDSPNISRRWVFDQRKRTGIPAYNKQGKQTGSDPE